MQELKLVKNLTFGETARSQVLTGVEKLTNAVGSTLGASGKCVILEDKQGSPQITKDGVTVANAITLQDPLESLNILRKSLESLSKVLKQSLESLVLSSPPSHTTDKLRNTYIP